METREGWSHEAAKFLRLRAQARSRSVRHILRSAAVETSITRWSALFTHAEQAPFAASLVLQDPAAHTSTDATRHPSAHSLNTTPAPHPWHPALLFDFEGTSKLWTYSQSAETVSVTPDQNTDFITQSKRRAKKKKSASSSGHGACSKTRRESKSKK